MDQIKILNLYAGIGGNRKNWDGEKHDITHVEWDEEVAQVLQDNFPNDEVVIGDAHEYLQENFQDYDFIWASPPCPSHSRIRKSFVGKNNDGQNDPIYPDMKLWQEILFLKGYFNGEWVVENVRTWYDPFIKPQESGEHYFWSSFAIPKVDIKTRHHDSGVEKLQEHKGFDLSDYSFSNKSKEKVLRNCVHPKLGEKILEACGKTKQQKLAQIT